jgi:hypothetical protein
MVARCAGGTPGPRSATSIRIRAGSGRRDRQLDRGAVRGELARVGEQVADHLLESQRIGGHGGQARRRDLDRDPTGGGGAGLLGGLEHELVEVDRHAVEGQRARLDLLEVEQVVDERGQVARGVADPIEVGGDPLARQAVEVLAQEFGHPDDRRQRALQVVGGDRDHVGLELIEALELGVLAHQLGVAALELGLGALALADVLVVGDVADARAAGVAHRADPHEHVQLATVASAIDQLARPRADRGVGDRAPHLTVEGLGLAARLEHAGVLTDHLAQRVAEQVEEGAVTSRMRPVGSANTTPSELARKFR